MAVDANGRVFPCCSAPRPDADLVFAWLGHTDDPFNSPKYRAARQHFAGLPDSAITPHCARCTWQQETAAIDRIEIRQYLRGIGAFSPDTLNRLTSW